MGAYDGDLVLVLDNKTMMEGVDRNAAITLDIDDKVCALVEADTVQNKTDDPDHQVSGIKCSFSSVSV